jgi:hypothetical protein
MTAELFDLLSLLLSVVLVWVAVGVSPLPGVDLNVFVGVFVVAIVEGTEFEFG